jgi:methionyl-tRNA formyltransferase
LRALVGVGHQVVLAVTRADKRRGRGGALSPSPVKEAATALGIPVTTDVDAVIDSGAELGVVVAFGRIIKPHVLAAVPMVNLHFSLLPRWRGAAPVERAILAGDPVTGVCVMAVEEGLDTGGTYACREVAIGPDETADELRARLVEVGTGLLVDVLAGGLPLPPPAEQRGEPTYAAKVEPDELRLDWSQPAEQLARVVRVGGAWTTFGGKRLKVHRARVGPDGRLELVEVQPEGKGRMPFADWARGARWQPGQPFE